MTLLAIDQGTTGTTALLVAHDGKTLGRATVDFPQHFPKPGWVEHDPEEIWTSVRKSVRKVLELTKIEASSIAAIGITNQRETTVVWDKSNGKPVHRAIVWQCRRTAPVCDALKAEGHSESIRQKTGLVLDAYFSATKISWILDHGGRGDGEVRTQAERGLLAFGTIDSFLVSRLSNLAAHVTDVSNASRTLLFNLNTLTWDDELLRVFRVPDSLLPKVVSSAEIVARTKGLDFLPDGIPVSGIAGDQQAALFGQACFAEGDAKCTYGTGAFLLMNVGETPLLSRNGLVTTVAWSVLGKTVYALEGSSFIAGAAVQWLRDGLGIIKQASEIEVLAATVPDTGGVTFVPALAGLGAPYWDPNARGTLTGLTRGTTKAHIARAALAGVALQTNDLLCAMENDLASDRRRVNPSGSAPPSGASSRAVQRLRVDGGAAANNILMQMQADYSGVRVERPKELESTGRGAAMLAAIGAGVTDLASAATMVAIDREFESTLSPSARNEALDAWKVAIAQTRCKG
jgi:glycerol kinase